MVSTLWEGPGQRFHAGMVAVQRMGPTRSDRVRVKSERFSVMDAVCYEAPAVDIAELEMEMITSRMKENRLVRWRDGRIFCGKPPYGYAWNPKEKRIEIEPEQAEIYSRVVKEYLDLGRSLNDISIELNAEGIPTRNGGSSKWSSGTLSKILKSNDYCGEITVNKYLTDAKGKIIGNRPESEHIVFEAPPLITRLRWDELQKHLDANARSGRPSNAARDRPL